MPNNRSASSWLCGALPWLIVAIVVSGCGSGATVRSQTQSSSGTGDSATKKVVATSSPSTMQAPAGCILDIPRLSTETKLAWSVNDAYSSDTGCDYRPNPDSSGGSASVGVEISTGITLTDVLSLETKYALNCDDGTYIALANRRAGFACSRYVPQGTTSVSAFLARRTDVVQVFAVNDIPGVATETLKGALLHQIAELDR